MPPRRKPFPCGHIGFGAFCHRCVQEAAERDRRERLANEKTAARIREQQQFDRDPVNLRGLPPAIVEKAREVLSALAAGGDYRRWKGKRLNVDRKTISIPLSRDYRLLCADANGRILPRQVLGHEDYNKSRLTKNGRG
jgi:hypothetical protein